ncbi:MAG TPA: hypothetical protein VMW82_01065 [Candidatus Paceibacterota bacterium]|nr:hypothetical protein [Candidatus Paceibacterota bacterium]
MKKQIFTILLIATILGSTIGAFFFNPKKANAVFGIGDISIDIVNQIKDWVLDQLPKTVARSMMVRLQQEIARWAQGGFTDENKPFAMISWKEEVKNALQIASSRFVSEFNLTPLCSPFKVSLGTALGINMPGSAMLYETYAACTISDIVDNVEEFYKNPSIAMYGWDTWTALAQPNNNFVGSFMMALSEKKRLEQEEITEVEKEVEAGQGIKNETICNLTDQQKCAADCNQYPATTNGLPNPIYVACMSSCEKSSIGVCLEETTIKLGSEIKTSVDKAIGSDIDWLISADEITEMINLVFSGLFNKLTHGINGMLTKGSSSTTTISKNQIEYGYYEDYKKTQTPQDITKVKGDILNNILKSIQSVSTAGYACDKNEQIKGDVFREVATDVLNEESQHLYTTMEGINLKPDYEVLDAQPAVNNKIAIYGVTWDDVPFNKYPEKCASIANKKCSDVKTGLPYELSINNINAECVTGCLEQINNYQVECLNTFNECEYNCKDETCKTACHTAYSACRDTAKTKAVNDKKCSSIAVADACLNGQALISKTKNSCSDCIKKYEDFCALKETKAEKDLCIQESCGDYEDISSSIKSAQDFYDRCALNETKYYCEVCLKEYFMPADYCGQVYDYINRSFVKYPALVYHNTWWGGWVNFEGQSEELLKNPFVACAPPLNPSFISTALTCRILPDFQFPGGGTCKTLCKTTEEELKNITDNEPQELDCTGPLKDPAHPEWGGVWHSGGLSPGGQYATYLAKKKIKCCAAVTGHMPEEYKLCRGITSDPVQELEGWCENKGRPLWKNPECFCEQGWRPIDLTKNVTTGLDFYSPWYNVGRDDPEETCSRASGGVNILVPNMSKANKAILETNSAAGGSIVYVAEHEAIDPDLNSCLYEKVCAGTNLPLCENRTMTTSCDFVANEPTGIICSEETVHTPSAYNCCNSGGVGSGKGVIKVECDLGGYKNQKVFLGVYDNDETDCRTVVTMCIECDSSDPGYDGGSYGFRDKDGNPIDQCNWKVGI